MCYTTVVSLEMLDGSYFRGLFGILDDFFCIFVFGNVIFFYLCKVNCRDVSLSLLHDGNNGLSNIKISFKKQTVHQERNAEDVNWKFATSWETKTIGALLPLKNLNKAFPFRTFWISLIPQHYYKLNFLSTWATKSCPGFCHVVEFTYLSVAKTTKRIRR